MTATLRQDQGRRRKALLANTAESPPCSCAGFGEFVGGTAAEWVVVWCCFTCRIVNLLVVFVYNLPREIYRRSRRAQRRAIRSLRSALHVHLVGPKVGVVGNDACSEEEVRRVEKEMWKASTRLIFGVLRKRSFNNKSMGSWLNLSMRNF